MSRYMAVFNIDNKLLHYNLDMLVNNTVDGYLVDATVPCDMSILFPISTNGDKCFVSVPNKNWKIILDGKEITERTEIIHGSYMKFYSAEGSYSILLIDVSEQSLNSMCYKLDVGQNVFIGRNPDSNIVLNTNDSISRKHAAIRVDNKGEGFVEDLCRNSGVFLNGNKVISSKLECGDIIQIMGNSICFMGDFLIIPQNITVNNLPEVKTFDLLKPKEIESENPYIRTPRILKSLEEDKIVIDAPTQPQKSKQIPFILTAGPSATMAFGMMASFGVTLSNALNGGSISSSITGGVMVVSMLLGALMWPSLLRNYNKRQETANEKYRIEKYRQYLLGIEAEIKKAYDRNVRIWNENLLPDIKEISKVILNRSINLWERTAQDEDFLEVRLGIGIRPFEVEIQIPHKGFTLYDDPLIEQIQTMAEKYKHLRSVPMSVSLLKKRTIGIVGEQENIENIVRCMILNLVALHSPDDVKICVICDGFQSERFEWVKELPHCWNQSKDLRYFATSALETYRLLNDVDEKIQEREEMLSKEDIRTPHIVVFILNEKLVEGIPFYRHLINVNNNLGISAVFAGVMFNRIPKECETIIQHENDICGIYIKNENKNRFLKFSPDKLNCEEAKMLSQSISSIPIKIEASKLSIPSRVSFLDMYKVGNIKDLNIEQKWENNISDKSLAVPLGVRAGGDVFSLDIHEKYHGCHGLVAGMTGSGKSEFLQAYILSAMINYSPAEIAFVLVDFKGGDMARPFFKTPHLSATISNLSGNILYRALVSLEAEVKSRQNIFNKSAEELDIDKIDINSYHKYFKEGKLSLALPHLVIVIDEFAQLKSQQPEFMSKLIEIAQVGRSLGIHLILATQKPSGVVDPQIWSNSRFKVCLKVLDKQDSKEMINRPDAALIKLPGRAYIQVGYDEVFEQIQSGYSGAEYVPKAEYTNEDDITVKMIDSAAMPVRSARFAYEGDKTGKTQLEETISDIVEVGKKKQIQAKPLWLEPLCDNIVLSECMSVAESDFSEQWDKDRELNVICGMMDIIETQKQIPYMISLVKTGHIAIYGASGTGKTTLLQTMIFSLVNKYSPEMLNIFAFDFGGRNLGNITKLPHCVNVAFGDEEDKISYMIAQILECIEKRKVLFAQNNCGTYEAYLSATKRKLPAVLVVLDNYSVFREKMFKNEDDLVRIAANAKSYGVYMIVTGNAKNAIYYKVSEHISNNITLKMNDRMNYRDILNASIPIEPENIKGRGLIIHNKMVVEFQAALPLSAENESERMDEIIKIYSNMNDTYSGNSVSELYVDSDKKINDTAKIQERTINTDISNKKSVSVLSPVRDDSHSVICGTSDINGTLQGFLFKETQKIFVGVESEYYPSRFIERIYRLKNTIIFDTSPEVPNGKNYKSITNELQIHEMIDFLSLAIKERTTELQMLHSADLSDEDIYGYMQKYERIIVLIRAFDKFYDVISDNDLKTFLTLLKQIKQIGIHVITLGNMKNILPYIDTALFIQLVKTDTGMIIGGKINNEMSARLSDKLREIPLSERNKPLPENHAFMYDKSKWSVISID